MFRAVTSCECVGRDFKFAGAVIFQALVQTR